MFFIINQGLVRFSDKEFETQIEKIAEGFGGQVHNIRINFRYYDLNAF